MNPPGIDVSHYQGVIDWNALYDNTAFVFIKATDGLGVDPQFKTNQAGARQVGIPCGFYHFARAGNADNEAQNFYNNLGALVPGEWLILDWEVDYDDPVGWCLNFFQAVKNFTNSQTAGVLYIDVDRLKTYDWQPVLDFGVVIWVANPSNLSVPYPYVARQTGFTTVPGISGEVDADIFNANNMDSFRHYGYQPPTEPTPPVPEPAPEPKPEPTPEPTPPSPVPVPPRQSLWYRILRFFDIIV